MSERLFLSASWQSPQRANVRTCTEKLLGFLIKLRDYDPTFFSDLYGFTWTKKRSLSRKISFNYASVKKNVFDKRFKDEDYLGYNTREIWNGKDKPEWMEVCATIGDYRNLIVVEFPTAGEMYNRYKDKQRQLALLRIMIDHWHPEVVNASGQRMYPPFENIPI